MILADATSYEEFYQGLKQLEFPLQAIIKDLRSQVVREGCITVAYLSTILGSKLDRMAEILMIPLINLIQNSAKVSIILLLRLVVSSYSVIYEYFMLLMYTSIVFQVVAVIHCFYAGLSTKRLDCFLFFLTHQQGKTAKCAREGEKSLIPQ